MSEKINLNYAVEQRIRFIDFLLAQYGRVNRSATINYFGIGPATATRDFNTYKKLCPGNMVFDEVAKEYLASTSFVRRWR